MTDARTTRCPQCHTVFRVTAAQLEARSGRVRCGRCRRVFDATQFLTAGELAGALTGLQATSLSALPGPAFAEPPVPGASAGEAAAAEAASTETAAPGPRPEGAGAATTPSLAFSERVVAGFEHSHPLRQAEGAPAGAPGPAELPDAAVGGFAAAGEDRATTQPANPAASGRAGDAAAPGEVRALARDAATASAEGTGAGLQPFSWEHRNEGGRRWLWAALVPLLALLLAAQAAYQLRHLLAARLPALRPALAAGCQWIGCRIEPPRARDRLSIEASELQADPAHRGLLVLTATLRNRADMAVAYPHLELTLTDLQQQPVARRAFAPGEYAGSTALVEGGIPANGEVALKLFIDASATQQQGYRLYLFYP